MRQKGFGRVTVEGELQNLHPREAVFVAQADHVVGDEAEVLCNDGQSPQCGGQCLQKLEAGCLNPAADACGGLGHGDLPIRHKTAEVIESDQVIEHRVGADALDPPGVALGTVSIPAVERVAPALPIDREVVRRHAGHDGRQAGVVEPKELGRSPDVGTVVGDENRCVTDDGDTASIGVGTYGTPLPIKDELQELLVADVVGQSGTRFGQCGRVALRIGWCPRRPGDAAVVGFQSHKQCVVG